MVNVRFSNYEQFLKFFANAPRSVQQILYKAYPDFAARMTNDYINATKKITQATTKAKNTTKEVIKAITQKPTNTSKPNPNLNDAFDALYGKGKQEVPKTKVNTPKAKVSKGIKVGKGGGLLATAQGLINLNDPNAETIDKVRGATMFGTGALGLASANPWLLGTAGALALGDALAEPIGNAIGGAISNRKYGKEEEWFNPETGILDITTDLKGNRLSPEDVAKIQAYNDKRYQEIANQYGQAMVPFGATATPQEVPVEQSGSIPSNYSQGVPQGSTPTNMGVIPQSFQNAQEGGVNPFLDILQANQIQPTLEPIVEPINYSNLYQQRANQLINELGGVQPQTGEQQMVDIEPYNQIRGYDTNGLRDDVIPGYLQVMQGISGGKTGLDYQKILEQYNAAAEADRKQNAINTLANMNRYQVQKAPLYYVGANGDLRAIEQDQQSAPQLLPTNTSNNIDKLTGQLAIQQAQQEQAAAQYKQYQDLLKAQQERIDMENQANALAQRFGGDPAMYMNKDIVNTLLKEIVNPDIQAQANIAETIGKAPTQAKLKQAEQLQEGANKLDEVALNQQYNAMIANINNNAKLQEQAMIRSGIDRITAAQIASNEAMNRYTQMMENIRALGQLQNAIELQNMKGTNAIDVAKIYRAGSGKSNEYDIRTAMDKDWNTLIGTGTPIPEAIQYMQAKYPGWGSTPEEQAELNR